MGHDNSLYGAHVELLKGMSENEWCGENTDYKGKIRIAERYKSLKRSGAVTTPTTRVKGVVR